MKRTLSLLLTLAVSAALLVLGPMSKHNQFSVQAQSGCSNATLSGNYAFLAPGFFIPHGNANEVPFAAEGVVAFDGIGSVSSSGDTAVGGGVISTQQSGTGTYTVKSDCTGSISFTAGNAAGLNLNLAIIGGGSELFAIYATPSFTVTFDGKKQ
jgi:hypothetical protein